MATALQQQVDMAPAHNSRRKDAKTASIVNQALLFQERIGTDYAAAYLNCKGVNVEVAIRVLSRPRERRKYY